VVDDSETRSNGVADSDLIISAGAIAGTLVIVIVAVVAIGYLEPRPTASDFDPQRDAAFKDTWDSRVHITYWEKWGSFEAEACQKMVDAFNESQRDIFVHYIRTSQVDRKSMLAIVGGEPPVVL